MSEAKKMIFKSHELIKTIEKTNTLPEHAREATKGRLIALFPYPSFQPKYEDEMKKLSTFKHDKNEFLLNAVSILKKIYEEETSNKL